MPSILSWFRLFFLQKNPVHDDDDDDGLIRFLAMPQRDGAGDEKARRAVENLMAGGRDSFKLIVIEIFLENVLRLSKGRSRDEFLTEFPLLFLETINLKKERKEERRKRRKRSEIEIFASEIRNRDS